MTDYTGWNNFGGYGGGENLGHPTPNVNKVAHERALSTPRDNCYVRHFRDMKVAEPEPFKPSTLKSYSTMCGWVLARAHAKVGDAPMIADYLGSKETFDEALVKYSAAYADQAERDFALFKAAIRSGCLRTKPDKASALIFWYS
jgi:hypothetical protein